MQVVHGWSTLERAQSIQLFLKLEKDNPNETFMDNLCEALDCKISDIENCISGVKPQRRKISARYHDRPLADLPPQAPQKAPSSPSQSFGIVNRGTISPKTMQLFLKERVFEGNFLQTVSGMGITDITLDNLLKGVSKFVMPQTVIKVCVYYGTTPNQINAHYSNEEIKVVEKTPKQEPQKPAAKKHYASYAIDIAGLGAYMAQVRQQRNMSFDDVAIKTNQSSLLVQAHEKGGVATVYAPFLQAYCEGMSIQPETIEEFCLNYEPTPSLKTGRRRSPT
jgi:hypothetical protein